MWTAIRWVGVFFCIGWPIWEFIRLTRENDEERDNIRQWTEDDL